MTYDFLVDTFETERIKILSVWSEFADDDLSVRPKADDPRGRSVLEHMVHQCVSEDLWFRTMLGIDVGAPPLPIKETRPEFMKRARKTAAGGSNVSGRPASAGGRVDVVFRREALARLGHDAQADTHIAPSRAANGHAADDRTRSAQQLRSHRRYWRPDAESCADHLRVAPAWRDCSKAKLAAAASRRCRIDRRKRAARTNAPCVDSLVLLYAW